MLVILEKISPSELVSNGYISNHNKVRCPRPKFNVSFYLYFCCLWINVTQINFENIKRKIQRIISDSCFQLKSWFNVDARVPSIPLLNFPFKFETWSWSESMLMKCGILRWHFNNIAAWMVLKTCWKCFKSTYFLHLEKKKNMFQNSNDHRESFCDKGKNCSCSYEFMSAVNNLQLLH